MKNITPDKDDLGQRLDRYLRKIFPGAKLGEVYEALRTKKILVNGKKIPESSRLRAGDVIECDIDAATLKQWQQSLEGYKTRTTSSGSLDPKRIVYQDDDILVYDKPSGLIVHSPDHATDESSLIDQIEDYLHDHDWHPTGTFQKPALAHRIDRDTSGLIITCLNRRSYEYMADLFRKRKIQKTYEALVMGTPSPLSGTIDVPLMRQDVTNHEAKVIASPDGEKAETYYEVVHSGKNWSLVRVMPRTGRTHQIRAHMVHIGHPLIGDKRYGGNSVINYPELKHLHRRFGHLLHACQLEFVDINGVKKTLKSLSDFAY